MRTTIIAICLICVACYGKPKDPAGWAKAAARQNSVQEKLQAVREARHAPGDRRAAVPHLVALLKEPLRVRAEVAMILGEFGDPAAIQPLLSALDATVGRDSPADAKEANRQVVTALGALRARAAVPALVPLLRSTDGFTQVATVDALGEIGDAAAVDGLIALANGDEVDPFVVRKALLALGRIADPRAGSVVLRLLYKERAGNSFFPEAAFAVYQIGTPLTPSLLALLKGEDREMVEWAKAQGVAPGVLRAKAAQLLGDMDEAKVAPALIEGLGYRDSNSQLQLFVRVFAAESLGRLRSRQAVQPLGKMILEERDPDARSRYLEALARIGDPAVLPAIRTAARQGTWEERGAALMALSRLGTAEDRELLVQAAKDLPAHATELGHMQERLATAGENGKDMTRWIAKLSDTKGWVRDRAALEVGRQGGVGQAEALAIAAARPVDSDDDLAARYHAILALEWVTNHGAMGGYAVAERLEALIEQEKGRSLTAGVNEEARRLAVRLRRLAAAH